MKDSEKLKMDLMGLYFEVEHLSEKARERELGNAGVVAYLKCAVSFIDAALETIKKKDRKMANEMMTLPQLMTMKAVQEKFVEILGKSSASFMASLMTIWNDDEKLKKCEPVTILAAAKQAAILQLPIMKQLGYSYVIPYYDGRAKKYVATFQIGYKGLLQLAMRSGVFRNLNAVTIYEGQLKKIDYLTGELEIGERTSEEVVGYAAYMELTNGFRKTLYMTKAEMEAHAQTYSDSYRADKEKKWSVWAKNFDAMAKKTVLKK